MRGELNAKNKISPSNYWAASYAQFREAVRPSENPDFISGEGDWQSLYYYTDKGLYRTSKHWGHVSQCYWGIGEIRPKDKIVLLDNFITGFVPWDKIKWAYDAPNASQLRDKIKAFKGYLQNGDAPKAFMTEIWLKNQISKAQNFLKILGEEEDLVN